MDPVEEPSFLKINYLLRPSKQVERKLFIEALHRLSTADYPIATYTYLGFGSVYYADFILFHKYLYIDQMICVEAEPIPRRMQFNKPFDFISLEMKPVADVLPGLDRGRRHVVWLDYDRPLDAEILHDIAGALHVLAPGSIFVVTVEAEPRLLEGEIRESLTVDQLIGRRVDILREQLGRYYPEAIGRNIYTWGTLPAFFVRVLRAYIAERVSTRAGLRFFQLFNFRYSDGTQMVSLGGLVDDAGVKDRLVASGIYDLEFIQAEEQPIRISVPPLTVREKQWLDQHLGAALTDEELAFELRAELRENFRKYYRHYPTFYETLV